MKTCPHCRGAGTVPDHYAFRAPGPAVVALQGIVAAAAPGQELVSRELTSRVIAAAPGTTRKQVWNAVTYLIRVGRLARVGHGRYRKVGG
jgi:hypothetical protein